MPALANPRHERFAQLIFQGLISGEPKLYSQSRAYIDAGYPARDTDRNHRSAQASSSRLLSRVIHRVRELQAIAAKQTAESADKCVRELNEVLQEARADKAHSAAVSAIATKAKILGLSDQQQYVATDLNQANSMQDIARRLLQSIGLREPDDASIAEAIELNDTFVQGLERIAAAAGCTIEQDDD
jgi:hypothetical protein